MPITNVTDWSRPPTSAPIRFAPSAWSFRAARANDRMKTMPLKSIGRLVSEPTSTALVAHGQEGEPGDVDEVQRQARCRKEPA